MRQLLSRDDKSLPANQLAASLIDIAVSRGADKDRLLRGTGIFIEDIRSGKLLTVEQLLKLFHQAAKLTVGNDCGFQLGQRLFPGNYGAISEALLYSRDLRDAFRLLKQFRMSICPFLSVDVREERDFVYLFINDSVGAGEQWQFLLECYCTALVSSSRFLIGKRVTFFFEFPFKRPRYIQEYEEHLGLRLSFEQPTLVIKFATHWLDEPFTQHSRTLKYNAIAQARATRVFQASLLDAVRNRLVQRPNTTLQHLASELGISPATLKRKLKAHGACFQSIHDEVRRQQAVYFLKLRGLNNEQCAEQMSFNDIPNFRRAVKRWTGLTPSQLKGV